LPPQQGRSATIRRIVRRHWSVLLGVAIVVLLAPASAAHACSCAGGIPTIERYRAADAAVVGTVLSRRETPPRPDGTTGSGDPSYVRLRVDREYKADLPAELEIRTVRGSATCGYDELPVGTRLSTFLDRSDGEWTGGACDVVDEEELAVAAAASAVELPRYIFSTVSAGTSLRHELVATAPDGRTLARRPGAFRPLSVCAGGARAIVERRVAEGAEDRAGGVVVIDTATLNDVREVRAGVSSGEQLLEARCGDGVGKTIDLVITAPGDDLPPFGHATRVVSESSAGVERVLTTAGLVLGVAERSVLTFDGRRLRVFDRFDRRSVTLQRVPRSIDAQVFGARILLRSAQGAVRLVRIGARRVWTARRRDLPAAPAPVRLVPGGVFAGGSAGTGVLLDHRLRRRCGLRGLGPDPVLYDDVGGKAAVVVNRPGTYPRLATFSCRRGVVLRRAVLRDAPARITAVLTGPVAPASTPAARAAATARRSDCPYRGRT